MKTRLIPICWLGVALAACGACGQGKSTGQPSHPMDGGNPLDGIGTAVDGGKPETPIDGGAPVDGPTTSDDAGNIPLSGSCQPGRAPLRRLTRFEYNNTVRDLLGDTSEPANALPLEPTGNGFSNDADQQVASSLLVTGYRAIAKAVAKRAVANAAFLAKFSPCAGSVTTITAASCARTLIEGFAPAAYRRPLAVAEVDELLSLHSLIRTAGTSGDFPTASAGVIEGVLQSPDFLYRVEGGVDDASRANLKRPTGDEMATRLSYLFWGTAPDDGLRAAAKSGALQSAAGVKAQAARLLDDPRSHGVVRFFFDNLLPISQLAQFERDATLFPTFSGVVGSLMREETQLFLENEIFTANGSWPSVLTAPYTFVNERLATFYGMTGVTGDAFRKVPVDAKRLGLLTQGGLMTGTSPSNFTNPVARGSLVMRTLMCRDLQLPTDPTILSQVTIPDVASAPTARERLTRAISQPVCLTCHQYLDPPGFALENFDAVGLYRDKENGVTIDASVTIPGIPGTVNGGVELARKLAESPDSQGCFAKHWLEFAYGRTLAAADSADACLQESVGAAFRQAGFNVRQLLLNLTQTDAFLYLRKE